MFSEEIDLDKFLMRIALLDKDITTVNRGRKIYQETETGCYWCVDNLHTGKKAHLEVFDVQKAHTGEANLAGNIDSMKKKSGRRL